MLFEIQPPVGKRPDVADETEHRQNRIGLDSPRFFRFHIAKHNSRQASFDFEDILKFMKRKQYCLASIDGGLNFGHCRAVRSVLVTPMNQRHCRRAIAELVAPVESRVPAADDDNLLAAEILGIRYVIENSLAVPRIRALLRKPPRRKRTDPGGDHHRSRRKAVGLGNQDEVSVLLNEIDDVLAEERFEIELRRLLCQFVYEVLGQDFGKPSYVEDVLLGIQRRQLAAKLRKSVYNLSRGTPHSCVKRSENPGRTAADDRDVLYLVHRGKYSEIDNMKIYTKTGDAGQTGLFGGGRVSKDNPRVEAYGDVDELNAVLGFARAAEMMPRIDEVLVPIQRDLFSIGALLSTPDLEKMHDHLVKAQVDETRITELERAIDACEKELEPLKAFIVPGGTPKAAALHVARTVCRRAERRVIHLQRDVEIPQIVVVYLNRLSDLLFTLARVANTRAGAGEVTW